MRFCEECGAKLEDDAKFCEECGTAVEAIAEESVEVEPEVENVEIVPEVPLVEEIRNEPEKACF